MKRVTKETNVFVKINVDGTGVAENNTDIPFLDHMLDVSVSFLSFFLLLPFFYLLVYVENYYFGYFFYLNPELAILRLLKGL